MKRLHAILAIAGLAAATSAASASTLTLNFDTNYSNSTTPSGTSPWLQAVFETTAPNTVRLTLRSFLQASSEFVTGWYFNIDPAISPSNVAVSQVSGPIPGNIARGTNAYGAGPAHGFDLLIAFRPANNSNRFNTATSPAIFTLTGNGLTAESFNFLNQGSNPAHRYLGAAHVQGISRGDGSTWLAPTPYSAAVVPLPPAGWAGLATLTGLVGFGYARRRRSA